MHEGHSRCGQMSSSTLVVSSPGSVAQSRVGCRAPPLAYEAAFFQWQASGPPASTTSPAEETNCHS
jgi:hypothetical protein